MPITAEEFNGYTRRSQICRAARALYREGEREGRALPRDAGRAAIAEVAAGEEVSAGGYRAFCELATRVGPDRLGKWFLYLTLAVRTPAALEALLPFNTDTNDRPYITEYPNGCSLAALFAACRLGHLAVAERLVAYLLAGWCGEYRPRNSWRFAAAPEDPAVKKIAEDLMTGSGTVGWEYISCATSLMRVAKAAAIVAAAHGREDVFDFLTWWNADDADDLEHCRYVYHFDLDRYGITPADVQGETVSQHFVIIAAAGGSERILRAVWARYVADADPVEADVLRRALGPARVD